MAASWPQRPPVTTSASRGVLRQISQDAPLQPPTLELQPIRSVGHALDVAGAALPPTAHLVQNAQGQQRVHALLAATTCD